MESAKLFLLVCAFIRQTHGHALPGTSGQVHAHIASVQLQMVASEQPVAKRPRARGANKNEQPTIAVVGRPNVGKSTIYNRMTQSFDRGALVYDQPGVTRDRMYGFGFWNEYDFRVVDTGGLVFDDEEDRVFLPHIRQQAMIAMSESKVVLFVVDGQQVRSPLSASLDCVRDRLRSEHSAARHVLTRPS